MTREFVPSFTTPTPIAGPELGGFSLEAPKPIAEFEVPSQFTPPASGGGNAPTPIASAAAILSEVEDYLLGTYTIINTEAEAEQHTLSPEGAKPEAILGSLEHHDGDRISGFSVEDALIFNGINLSRNQLSYDANRTSLELGANNESQPDFSLQLAGEFGHGDFMAVSIGQFTAVTFETFLPSISDGQALSTGLVNGINNQQFLTGNGKIEYLVELKDFGHAGYDNSVGVYEIDSAGDIVDTRILFDNANEDKNTVETISDVENGHKLGFFILQDGADRIESLSNADRFAFVSTAGKNANLSDGSNIYLTANGHVLDDMVTFHSFGENLNPDHEAHAISGVTEGGESVLVGFEDMLHKGDQDYEDVIFQVTAVSVI